MSGRLRASARGLLMLISAAIALGCGQSASTTEEGVARSAILDGEASPAQQDATVLVLRQAIACTGVVVAPTLVLTARSCLYEVPDTNNGAFYTRCLPSGTGAPLLRAMDPQDFVIAVGTRPARRRVEATAKRFYSGETLDLCANDIGLIEVDTPLSVAPLAMRLDSRPRAMETGTVVGWGVTEDSPVHSPQVRQQRDVQVLAVGDSSYPLAEDRTLHVAAGSFITGEAGCFSDQGAPFISSTTGAVVGILSDEDPADPSLTLAPLVDSGISYAPTIDYCHGVDVYGALDTQSAWIRDAFERTHQVPWLEGKPPLVAAGQRCTNAGDCASGMCKSTTGGGNFCSQACDSQECPGALQCVGSPGDRYCVPATVPTRDDAAASTCAVRFSRRDRGAWLLLSSIAAIHLRRRRRTAGRVSLFRNT